MTALPIHPAAVTGQGLIDLEPWTSEVEDWPPGSHVWGHYLEETPAGAALCRTENVSACHAGFRSLVEGPLKEIAQSLLGVDVADFKDKINYKSPGGGGFSAHQDLTAYPGASEVVSILLAIDECSVSSGCLWLATGVDELLPTDGRGVISSEVVSDLEWLPAEMAPGDVLCLEGLAPHLSHANEGRKRRRVLVASYAPTRDHYTRDRYYSARETSMRRSAAGRGDLRISTIADFEGVRSSQDVPEAPGTCSHD